MGGWHCGDLYHRRQEKPAAMDDSNAGSVAR